MPRPETPRGRPGREAASEVEHTGSGADTSSVREPADPWATIRDGWCRAGDSLPRAGSVAWRLLDDADPVKAAAAVVADLDAGADVVRHGPSWARAMAEVTS